MYMIYSHVEVVAVLSVISRVALRSDEWVCARGQINVTGSKNMFYKHSAPAVEARIETLQRCGTLNPLGTRRAPDRWVAGGGKQLFIPIQCGVVFGRRVTWRHVVTVVATCTPKHPKNQSSKRTSENVREPEDSCGYHQVVPVPPTFRCEISTE